MSIGSVFFTDQSEFSTGDLVEIMNKASSMSLVCNAILYWNTIKIGVTVESLRDQGENISDDALSHISLLPYRQVLPNGNCFVGSPWDESLEIGRLRGLGVPKRNIPFKYTRWSKKIKTERRPSMSTGGNSSFISPHGFSLQMSMLAHRTAPVVLGGNEGKI